MNKKPTFFGIFILLISSIASFSALPVYLDPIIVDELLPSGYAEKYLVPTTSIHKYQNVKNPNKNHIQLEAYYPNNTTYTSSYFSSISNNTTPLNNYYPFHISHITFSNSNIYISTSDDPNNSNDSNSYYYISFISAISDTLSLSQNIPIYAHTNSLQNFLLTQNPNSPANPQLTNPIALTQLHASPFDKFGVITVKKINQNNPENQDNDSLNDFQEIFQHKTNPMMDEYNDPLADPDQDSISNGFEIELGSNMLIPNHTYNIFYENQLDFHTKELHMSMTFSFPDFPVCGDINQLGTEWTQLLSQPWNYKHINIIDCILDTSTSGINQNPEPMIATGYNMGRINNNHKKIQSKIQYQYLTNFETQPNTIYKFSYMLKQVYFILDADGEWITDIDYVEQHSFWESHVLGTGLSALPLHDLPSGATPTIPTPSEPGFIYPFIPIADISIQGVTEKDEVYPGLFLAPNEMKYFNIIYNYDEQSFPYEQNGNKLATITINTKNNNSNVSIYYKAPAETEYSTLNLPFSFPAHETDWMNYSFAIKGENNTENQQKLVLNITFEQYFSKFKDEVAIHVHSP